MPTFDSLDEQLLKKGRNATSKKLDNNTYAERRGEDVIAVRLHATDVVTYFRDGRVVLDTGGWRTVTTKDRINGYGPRGVSISSIKGEWRVFPYGFAGEGFPFADGFTLQTTGGLIFNPVPGTYPDDSQLQQQRAAAKKLDKDIAAYLAKLKGAVEHWKLQLESQGSLSTTADCFYCQGIVTTPDGGKVQSVDHIWSHLRELYVFPSLVLNAYRAKGYRQPERAFAMHVAGYGQDILLKVVKGYLKKTLGASSEPAAAVTDALKLERAVNAAVEVLEKPGDFGYFGSDESLWVTSAPTWTKHRDSSNEDIANFEVVWNTLTAEFPHLVPACTSCTDGAVDERTLGPIEADTNRDNLLECTVCNGTGQLLDDEHYPPRDYNPPAPGALYVFGAGHWAVGHIDQIVVPVKLHNDTPVGVDNLHPAFLRLMELREAVTAYPLLDGAEDIVSRLEDESQLSEARQYLAEGATDEQVRALRDVLLEGHGDWDYVSELETSSWLAAIDSLQLTPAAWVERHRSADAASWSPAE